MRPGTEPADAPRADRHRHGVRLFVALHLLAVGTMGAVAVAVGAGDTGPTLPPVTLVMVKPQSPPPNPAARSTVAAPARVTPTPLPEWSRRPEIAAPWAPR